MEKNKDLEEDEELVALREAALASLKPRPLALPETESTPNHIAPINSIVPSTTNYTPYSASYDQIEQPGYNNQYPWRNATQATRRGRAGRIFPKTNQRSNLIVITPRDDASNEKSSASHLILPQHKWCQSINEDSSSPKTYRRTGPTRFNRHGSDSSDSDYENSDNDSYSNETVLQDEPSEHFAGQSPEQITDEISCEKPICDRRLSFQNLDSNLDLENFQNIEATSVYKCLKSTYPRNSPEKTVSVFRSSSIENESESSWKHDSHRNYIYSGQYNDTEHPGQLDSSSSHLDNQTVSLVVNGESSPKKYKLSSVLSPDTNSIKLSRKHSEVQLVSNSHSESSAKKSVSNTMNQSRLSENDLRLELKKRMHEMNAKKEDKFNKSPDNHLDMHTQNQDKSHLQSSDHSESRNHLSNYNSSRKKHRSRSRSANRNRSLSPYRNRHRGRSRSAERYNQERHREKSIEKNRRHSAERHHRHSPEKHHRNSPERHHKRDRSQSLVRDRQKDQNLSLHGNRKQNHSRSQERVQDHNLNPNGNNQKSRKRSHRHSSSSSSSSLSSSTTSSTSSSSSNSSLPKRSVSSVIKPAQRKDEVTKSPNSIVTASKKIHLSSDSDSQITFKKGKLMEEKPKLVPSTIKSSISGGEIRNNDGSKRVPVHMRLGTLRGKRIIQMTKDVEAAFVNTSSDDDNEDLNPRGKKENFRVVCNALDNKKDENSKRHVERNTVHSVDIAKDRRFKVHR